MLHFRTTEYPSEYTGDKQREKKKETKLVVEKWLDKDGGQREKNYERQGGFDRG